MNLVLPIGAALLASTAADLTSVMSEANLEKRSRAALEHAEKTLDAAREAYRAGDWPKTEASIGEIRKSVELALESLRQSGKDPAKGSRYFKIAEIKTRELARKLDGFAQSVSFDERDPVEKVKAVVQKIHDDILDGIMGKKGTWGRK